MTEQEPKLYSNFAKDMIRKKVFGGKKDTVRIETFKEQMDLYCDVLLNSEMIRSEFFFFVGRQQPDLFESAARMALDSATDGYISSSSVVTNGEHRNLRLSADKERNSEPVKQKSFGGNGPEGIKMHK